MVITILLKKKIKQYAMDKSLGSI